LQATLGYDADCGFCQSVVALIKRLDSTQQITLEPLADNDKGKGFRLQCNLANGQPLVWYGAEALPHLLQRLPAVSWLAYLWAIPGFTSLVAWGYGLVAKNRYRLSRWLGKFFPQLACNTTYCTPSIDDC
jgi:predicted DCC family thiol-disulfide oxidoreductase YuxK